MAISTVTLDCGLEVLVEPIPSVASVGVSWLVPAGAASDPPDGDGHSAMLSELIFRGAGSRDSRALSDAFDRLGVDRSSRCLTHHIAIDASLRGDRLEDAWPLIVDLVRAPQLADPSVEPVRSLCLQTLASLDDDPQHLVMLHVGQQHMPPPFNRHGYGDPRILERVTGERLRATWAERARPKGSILAVAGAVDADQVARTLAKLTAGWSGAADEPVVTGQPARGHTTLTRDTAQVHIGLAYDAPPEPSPDTMRERLATYVLSGSTSGRLFTEVRQKRSLCYSVGASYRAGRDRGMITLYAGTTPPRAQETLDVCVQEIARLQDGVTEEEFARAVTGLKSSIVRQGESTAARARAIAQDQFKLGHARTLDDLAGAVDSVSRDELNAYVAGRAAGPFTIVSIGPAPLEKPAAPALAGSSPS